MILLFLLTTPFIVVTLLMSEVMLVEGVEVSKGSWERCLSILHCLRPLLAMIRLLTVREYSSTHVISNLTSCGDLADSLISMCRDCKANEVLYVL